MAVDEGKALSSEAVYRRPSGNRGHHPGYHITVVVAATLPVNTQMGQRCAQHSPSGISDLFLRAAALLYSRTLSSHTEEIFLR